MKIQAFPVCLYYTVAAHVLNARHPKRYRPEDCRGDPRSRLGGIFAGRLHPCDSRHEKRSRAENQRLHGKRRMKTAKNDCAGCRKCSDRRQFFISGAFRSEFPFGSGLGRTEKSQNSPSKKVLKTQKNPAEIEKFQPGFGRRVGIRTRGLLVPKVGRIFFTDISGHFCTFPLGKFHSGVLSCTNKST